jgi:hypothetical protein
MHLHQKRILVLVVLVAAFGCTGGTKWEPIAESVCKKYKERITIMKNIRTRSDAKNVVSTSERWHSEYEALVDEFHSNLRQYDGVMDFATFDSFRKRWSQIDNIVNEERERLRKMHGTGPEYDPDLGKITRTSFTNPFR